MLLTVAGFPAGSFAARVENLYAAEVPLPDGSADRLPAAFDIALGKVLVKVTGRPDIAQDSAVLGQIGDSSRLVQQYRIGADNKVWASFDQPALKAILDASGQPIWGNERPATLVWLAVDAGGGQREIMAAEPDLLDGQGSFEPTMDDRMADLERQIRERLLTAADDRGIPLILPLMDSEDLTAVSFADVWGGFSGAVSDAAERYDADALLIGRVRAFSADSTQARWTLMLGEERFKWEGDLYDGPNELANILAARLATEIGTARRVRLQVAGIDSLDAYGKVSVYLKTLDLVEACDVVQVSGDTVLYGLEVRGDLDQLMRTIALRRLLQPQDQLSPGGMSQSGAIEPDLRYRLVAGS